MEASAEVHDPSLNEILSQNGLEDEDLDKECSQAVRFKIGVDITSWKTLGHYLGIPSKILDTIEEENSTKVDCGHILLYTWHKREGRYGTYQKLITALYNQGRLDLVKNLCKLIKSDTAVIVTSSDDQLQPNGASDGGEERLSDLSW